MAAVSAVPAWPGRRAGPDAPGRRDAHRLAAVARDCEAAGIARRCLLLRLSRLPPDLRKPHHLRLARDALDPMLAADRAERFILPNNDIAVVWRGAAPALLEASEAAVTAMLADSDADGPADGQLWQVLDLPAEAAILRACVDDSLRGGQPRDGAGPSGGKLDTATLAALETGLARADLARFARRRAICRPGPDGRFRIGWEARFLSADAICAELADGQDARAEPFLYRRLARTLDRRMLALLASAQELLAARPFGLDLSVASVVGPEFLRFDAALPQALRGRVTLGFDPADLLADLPAFGFARDFAHSRGYRLLVRLPDARLLPVLPPARLGVDLAELIWSREAAMLPSDLLDAHAARLVLSGADSVEALVWGRANGIGWFEGRAAAPGRAVAGAPRLDTG